MSDSNDLGSRNLNISTMTNSNSPEDTQDATSFDHSSDSSSLLGGWYTEAVYDIVFRCGTDVGDKNGYRGEIIEFKYYEPDAPSPEPEALSPAVNAARIESQLPVSYRAYFTYGVYKAIYSKCTLPFFPFQNTFVSHQGLVLASDVGFSSCTASDDKTTFSDFQLVRINEAMQSNHVNDPLTLEFVDGMMDDNHNPLLKFYISTGYLGGAPTQVYGFAKMSIGDTTTLSRAERRRCKDYWSDYWGEDED
jgi:hypothetical protein